MGSLIPLFWTSGEISFEFQSQSGQRYLHLAQVYTIHIPKSHLWCDTCWPLDGQHGGQLLFPTFMFQQR